MSNPTITVWHYLTGYKYILNVHLTWPQASGITCMDEAARLVGTNNGNETGKKQGTSPIAL